MSLRKLLTKEVVIRLTETGFVETVQYFGLPVRSLYYAVKEPSSALVPVRLRVDRNRAEGAP
jgi:hypothetical protein